ncbi:MAG: NAD(P)-binding domain-containing protein [Leptospira sp.]|nr:NAD(P)-binding domain-containing protein [Leptospira sp.]
MSERNLSKTTNPKRIAIIGSGNVGGALATGLSKVGHTIHLGVRDPNQFKGKELLRNPKTLALPIKESVTQSEVIILATPAAKASEVAKDLGDTTGKIIIDTMNTVLSRGADGFSNTSDAILANTKTRDVVKCFNTTGFGNMENPSYGSLALDMFCAGDSKLGIALAKQFAIEIGFENCYYVGGNDRFELMEQFAFFWINLAMFQGLGREFGFKILKGRS